MCFFPLLSHFAVLRPTLSPCLQKVCPFVLPCPCTLLRPCFVVLSIGCVCFHAPLSACTLLTPPFFSPSLVCVLFSSLIHVQCTESPLCLFYRLCVLSLSLICVYSPHTLLCLLVLGSACLHPPPSYSSYSHLSVFPPCLESVYFFFIFSMMCTQSQLLFLCRLYVFSFSFISTNILPSWMKPYIEIWDHGLLNAWKYHQSEILHANV